MRHAPAPGGPGSRGRGGASLRALALASQLLAASALKPAAAARNDLRRGHSLVHHGARPAVGRPDAYLAAQTQNEEDGTIFGAALDPFDVNPMEHFTVGRRRQDHMRQAGPHGVGLNFFSTASAKEWWILISTCLVLLLADLLILKRLPQTFMWHIATILLWIAVAALYNVGVLVRTDSKKALEWTSGYLLEWMLSMDNLFVFHLIFQTYQTPSEQIHKAVFIGIIGAVCMRLIFFMVVSTLLHAFGWFRWPFGLLLVWSGIEAARGDDEEADVKDTLLVRCLKRMFGKRLHEGYDEQHALFCRDSQGRWQVTLLLIVILLLEFSDILFALDSVSAKVAQISDPFTAFSSSVLAMYGLRAMFFVVHDLVEMFDLLKYGLGVILVFIGIELMFAHYIQLSSQLVCSLIFAIFAASIASSYVKNWWTWRREMDGKKGPTPDAGAAAVAAPATDCGSSGGPEAEEPAVRAKEGVDVEEQPPSAKAQPVKRSHGFEEPASRLDSRSRLDK